MIMDPVAPIGLIFSQMAMFLLFTFIYLFIISVWILKGEIERWLLIRKYSPKENVSLWGKKCVLTTVFLLLKLCEWTNYGVSDDYTKRVMKLCTYLKEYYHETLHHISAAEPRNDRRGKDGWGEQGSAPVRNSISSLTLFTTASIWCTKKADCLLVNLLAIFKFPRDNELPYYLHPGQAALTVPAWWCHCLSVQEINYFIMGKILSEKSGRQIFIHNFKYDLKYITYQHSISEIYRRCYNVYTHLRAYTSWPNHFSYKEENI